MKFNKTENLFWLITSTFFVIFFGPVLLQKGMFLDGVTYAAISNNLANGLGSFWDPHYTQELYPNFREHPSLVFGIQSVFFKIIGSGFYVERIYSLLTAIITAYGIVLVWNLFQKEEGTPKVSWLPVFLWITIPVVFWSYQNNMLENTMTIFVVFSVYFATRSFQEYNFTLAIIGSLLIVAAFFSKGFVGLFPLAVPFFYILVFKTYKDKKALITAALFVIIPFAVTFLIFKLVPESIENIHQYIDRQLLPALEGEREVTTSNRFKILSALITELAFPIVVLLFFVIRNKVKTKSISAFNLKPSIYFFLIGVSGALPLIISLKQRKFYLTAPIPFFILAISVLLAPYVAKAIAKIGAKTARIIRIVFLAIILVVVSISIFKAGDYARDKEKLADVYTISNYIENGTVLSTTKELWQDWGLVAYMARVNYISLDCDNELEYFLVKKEDKQIENIKKTYSTVNLDLKQYQLLKRKN